MTVPTRSPPPECEVRPSHPPPSTSMGEQPKKILFIRQRLPPPVLSGGRMLADLLHNRSGSECLGRGLGSTGAARAARRARQHAVRSPASPSASVSVSNAGSGGPTVLLATPGVCRPAPLLVEVRALRLGLVGPRRLWTCDGRRRLPPPPYIQRLVIAVGGVIGHGIPTKQGVLQLGGRRQTGDKKIRRLGRRKVRLGSTQEPPQKQNFPFTEKFLAVFLDNF